MALDPEQSHFCSTLKLMCSKIRFLNQRFFFSRSPSLKSAKFTLLASVFVRGGGSTVLSTTYYAAALSGVTTRVPRYHSSIWRHRRRLAWSLQIRRDEKGAPCIHATSSRQFASRGALPLAPVDAWASTSEYLPYESVVSVFLEAAPLDRNIFGEAENVCREGNGPPEGAKKLTNQFPPPILKYTC